MDETLWCIQGTKARVAGALSYCCGLAVTPFEGLKQLEEGLLLGGQGSGVNVLEQVLVECQFALQRNPEV